MQNPVFWGLAALAIVYFFMRPTAPAGASMNPHELRSRIATEPELQIVDVRTPAEFAENHLKGAKNIPLDSLASRLGEIKKDKPLALYCRSGNRSGTALRLVRDQGFLLSKHLEGGILAWQREGLPL